MTPGTECGCYGPLVDGMDRQVKSLRTMAQILSSRDNGTCSTLPQYNPRPCDLRRNTQHRIHLNMVRLQNVLAGIAY